MKKIFLLIVAPILLVTLGFGQTPAPSSNTDQASINGCLSGSDGNYTVAEDGTTQIYKVTSSTVDLKPHVGHDITVTGQKTTATSSGLSDNSVVVTGVSMISDHCTPATVGSNSATAGTTVVADTTPTATTSTPVAADGTTTATASTPVVADPAPATTTADPTPTTTDPAPAATATTPVATASTPANTDQLPNTATSLPLLGLLGLGLLGFGLLTTSRSRRSRTNQQ